ncbi:Cyclin-D2-2 [Platanthera guangdongensis]|uniref:Cyclin-D2-2 n=1 Tax=Platanthera guangdongensis TaxID=2320717 RepID=A0ABR2N5C8_9ASPA
MGVAYQNASSILLCGEDNSFVGDAEEMGTVGEAQASIRREISGQIVGFRDSTRMVFPLQSEECLNDLLEKETDHLPAADYAERLMNGALDVSSRKDAVDWIQKAHAYYGFGSMSAYLSVNYLDRFVSAHDLPQGKAWMMQLLAVACLSLAIKMEETEVPLSVDLQQIVNAKYVFEAKAIQRMELLVLSKLKWRMKAATPFSFIEYFMHKFNNGTDPKEHEINHCVELILSTIRGIYFLEFKPSEVAAASTISALSDTGSVPVEKYLNGVSIVDKVKVMECYEALQHLRYMEERYPRPASSMPQSPIGVLDAVCLSCNNSDETISSSNENSQNNSPASKKRKLSCTSAS